MDVLADLVKSIEIENEVQKRLRKSAPRRSVRKTETPAPQRKRNTGDGQYVQKSGAGGIIMQFGSGLTGNRVIDNYNKLLNSNCDATQQSTAEYQQESFNKALGDYVDMGEAEYQKKHQIEEQVQTEKSERAYAEVQQEYKSTAMNVGGEQITAQSETDKAVMEMFQNQELD